MYPDEKHLVWQIGQGLSKVSLQVVIWREAISRRFMLVLIVGFIVGDKKQKNVAGNKIIEKINLLIVINF